MKYSKTMLAASIAASLYCSAAIHAADSVTTDPQQTAVDAKKDAKRAPEELGTVIVTGIRKSEAEAIALKKDADTHVEVVTAEDIGKLPAKNVADTLARLPGINIADAAGAEGGFDEADRVSMRGTAPALTLTTLNGHAVATGDWFVLASGSSRSVSYSLLPSEIVSEVVVHKTPEAKLMEGGAAGTVDIVTRKPLDFSKPLNAAVSLGGVYSDLPGKTKPQFDGLVSWKNADSTFGVLAQAFYEVRALQRNGQEMLGYSQISATSAVAKLHPDLAGVFYPNLPGAALFTQERTRKGGIVDIEWKPTDSLTFDLNAFYSHINETNYNRNFMLWNGGNGILGSNNAAAAAALQNYTVKNNILTSAQFASVAPGGANADYGIYDMISRPDEAQSSRYVSLDGKWRASDRLDVKFQVGSTHGYGKTPVQDVFETVVGQNAGSSWAMGGYGSPIGWSLGGPNSSPANSAMVPGDGWIFGKVNDTTYDKEDWGNIDASLAFDNSVLSSLDFGARYSNHSRYNPNSISQGPNWANWPGTLASYPSTYQSYPSNFGSSLGVPMMPNALWYYTPAQLAAIDKVMANRDPARFYPLDSGGRIGEKNTALYVQANFTGDRWSGNVGLRWVNTDQSITYTATSPIESSYQLIPNNPWGVFYWNTYASSYSKILPSANLKFNINDEVVARFAASQTLTRQEYASLATPTSLTDPRVATAIGSGTGGNPYLRPMLSTNFDASLEWYFSERGLLSASIFAMDLSNYSDWGTKTGQYTNLFLSSTPGSNVITPVQSNYIVSIPINVRGTVRGVELNYIQPIGEHFGAQATYTYSNSHESGGTLLGGALGTGQQGAAAGDRPLLGNSKNTVGLSGYFENQQFNARISYTYRSSFYDGFLNEYGYLEPYYQAGAGYLSASAGYTFNDWASVSFDAMNLNNPKLKYYTEGHSAGLNYGKAPEAFYVNGRQFYVTLRLKF
ncbi:MAG: TonB-dependent receptor [Proteobacteria bacterium]|nr:TonB-dependent receptor [Pseudomonadota bacterium]